MDKQREKVNRKGAVSDISRGKESSGSRKKKSRFDEDFVRNQQWEGGQSHGYKKYGEGTRGIKGIKREDQGSGGLLGLRTVSKNLRFLGLADYFESRQPHSKKRAEVKEVKEGKNGQGRKRRENRVLEFRTPMEPQYGSNITERIVERKKN